MLILSKLFSVGLEMLQTVMLCDNLLRTIVRLTSEIAVCTQSR